MITFDVRLPALHELVAENALADRVGAGFGFTEGPVWRGDHLIFSDIPRNRQVRWRPLPEGPEVTTFRTPTGNSNGLTLDQQGQLLACEHSGRRVGRIDRDGNVTTVVDRFEGKRLNSPNDIVVRRDGAIYFTDPPYGLPQHTEGKELPFNGVFRVAPTGEMTLLADTFERPNGLAFSPDESVLYVDDSARRHIRAFDVRADGSLGNDRIFLDMASPDQGSPDGMKVDVDGNVFSTGPGGIWVARASGELLGRIILPEQPANLAWGGEDWRTLFATARTGLYRIACRTQGIPVGA